MTFSFFFSQELLDDLHPSYEHLVANEVLSEQHNAIDQAQPKNEASEENLASSDADKIVEKTIPQTNDEGLIPPPPPPPVPAKFDEKKVMDLDEIANVSIVLTPFKCQICCYAIVKLTRRRFLPRQILLQKNIKGNMNCIVEKRRNEELVDHAPMALNLPSANLPFGLNITTPPRLQHLTGEQMIVICKGDEDEEKEAANDDALTDSEKVKNFINSAINRFTKLFSE